MNNIKKTRFSLRSPAALLLALCLLLPLAGHSEAAVDKKAYDIMSDIVYTYKMKPDSSYAHIRSRLAELKQVDQRLGNTWEELMDYWIYVNNDLVINYDCLPAGLPQDDSLCIIVLGYQLEPDGAMAEELIGRCTVALESAKAYPNAFIAVTGGGTAYQNREATEAGEMAKWLIQNGISEERILIEDRSQTTAENALFTYALLKEKPQIKAAAIITSDYHLPLGCLLFQEEFLLSAYVDETEAPAVFTNASLHEESFLHFSPREQALDLWSIVDTVLK